MSAARIPMTDNVAKLIGPAAQHVENRSLLLDKFVFHKNWGLHEIKANDAHRWSLLRISEDGSSEIARESKNRKSEATKLENNGKNPDKVARLRIEAKLADDLAATAKVPADLAPLRARHTRHLLGLFRKAHCDRCAITIGQLEGRLAINLADSLIQNAGICLDRLFGLPYIPGSAVKGVCRHAALAELKAATGEKRKELAALARAVFGCASQDADFQPDPSNPSDQKGAVSFLPAYPVNEARVVVNLTNVHYPLYYGGDKKRNIAAGLEASLKEEKPQPNPFPAVETGAQFAFCLVLNGMDKRPDVLAAAQRWLESALTERGLGAKTAAGYGWFSLQQEVLSKMLVESEVEATKAKEREQVATMEPSLEIMEKFKAMKEQDLAGALNKYAFEPKYWPNDSTVLYELSLFEFVKAEAGKLAETRNGKKAMTFLAQKLKRTFQ